MNHVSLRGHTVAIVLPDFGSQRDIRKDGATRVPSSHDLTSDSTSLRNREFPRSVFGSATPAPRRAAEQRFPNLVEGNGARERQDSALLDELMQ